MKNIFITPNEFEDGTIKVVPPREFLPNIEHLKQTTNITKYFRKASDPDKVANTLYEQTLFMGNIFPTQMEAVDLLIDIYTIKCN